MGVVVEGKAVVADVLSGVYCFRHRADSESGKQIFLAQPLHLLQHLVDGAVYGSSRTVDLHLMAKLSGNHSHVLHFILVGQVVDTINERLRLFSAARIADKFGDGAVGKEHELLHKLVCVLRFLEIDTDRSAVVIDVESHLDTGKVDRAILVTTFAKNLCEAVELEDFVGIVAMSGFNDILSLFVGESAVALDYGAANLRFHHVCIVVHLEYTRECKFFLIGT